MITFANIKNTTTYFKTRVRSLIACTATSYSLSRVIETIRSCSMTEMTHSTGLISSLQSVNSITMCPTLFLYSYEQTSWFKVSHPAGGANLEPAGEEFQSCIELSVVVEALQSCQTLQTYLTLLEQTK